MVEKVIFLLNIKDNEYKENYEDDKDNKDEDGNGKNNNENKDEDEFENDIGWE